MLELHKNTLTGALERLPVYAPPEGVWEAIADALEAEEALAAQVQALPQYEAPPEIWSKMEAKLPVVSTGGVLQRNFLRIVNRSWHFGAAAVAVGLLLGAWYWRQLNAGTGSAEMVMLHQKTVSILAVNLQQEPEDAAFAAIETLCLNQKIVCEQPDFIALKSELDELSAAKAVVRNALGPYGDDPTLTSELVQIERARSELLQQMMQLL
jgi:hypothetical protein